jgi:hypothetical protein
MQCDVVRRSQRTRSLPCSLASPTGRNFIDSKRKPNGVAKFVVPGVWCETDYGFHFRSMVGERLMGVEKGRLKSGVWVSNKEDALRIVQCC